MTNRQTHAGGALENARAANKSKSRQVGLQQTTELLHSQEAMKQNEKAAFRVEKRFEIFVNHILDKG